MTRHPQILALTLAATAGAQSMPIVTLGDYFPQETAVASSGPFGRAFPARLSGLATTDIVVLAGSTATLYAVTDVHTSQTEMRRPSASGWLAITMTDAAPLHGIGRDSANDTLAYVNSTGLRTWWIDESGSVRDDPATGAGTNWNNVTRIATHHSDNSIVYGIRSAGSTWSLIRATRGSTGTWTTATVTSSLPTCIAVGCAKFTATGAVHAIVMTATEWRIYTPAGSLVKTLAIPTVTTYGNATSGQLVVARDRLLNREVVGCLSVHTAGSPATQGSALHLFNDVIGTSGYQQLLATSTVYAGLHAGDLTLNLVDDIALTGAGQELVPTYFDVGLAPTPPPTMPGFRIQTEGRPASQPTYTLNGHFANAVITDCDNDADLDLVALGSRPSYQHVLSARSISISFGNPAYTVINNPAGTDQLLMIGSIPGFPVGATHLQVVAWRRPDGSTNLTPVAALNVVKPVNPQDPSLTEFEFEPSASELGEYWLVVRWVIYDARTNSVTAAGMNHTVRAQVSIGSGGVRIGGVSPKSKAPPTPSYQPPALPPTVLQ